MRSLPPFPTLWILVEFAGSSDEDIFMIKVRTKRYIGPVEQWAQRTSGYRGPEEQWEQRTRGPVGKEDQRTSGPVGTEDLRTRGTVGTEDQRDSGNRGPVISEPIYERLPRHLLIICRRHMMWTKEVDHIP